MLFWRFGIIETSAPYTDGQQGNIVHPVIGYSLKAPMY